MEESSGPHEKTSSITSNSDINRNIETIKEENSCVECNIKFDTSKSLEVHLQYHNKNLYSKWAAEGESASAPPPPPSPAPLTTVTSVSVSAGRVESPTVAAVSSPVGPGPASSMQISMAQSMGIQQGAPPHLTTHHTSPIFNSPESGQSETSPSTPTLPSINADVSEFFSQLESHPEPAQDLQLDTFQTNNGENKTNRFHPYGGRPTAYPSPTSSAMSQASSPSVQSYQSYNAPFNDSHVYQSAHEYLSFGDAAPTHDQSSEEIWDLDSHTVRRYNPVPDPVSPGPIPTTPTMYGQQMQIQNKPSWESNNTTNIYSPYGAINRGQTPIPQNMPPQPISPGLGAQWMGGMGMKAQSVADAKRPKSYQCEACDKWFTSSGHLKRHFNTTLHKNAMKQKGDGYIDGINGGSFSIPSVESRGAPSPCMSLGEESSQSSVCDDSQSTLSMSGTPVSTPGPVPSITTLNQPATSQPDNCSPSSNTSPNVPTLSPMSHQLLSPPPDPSCVVPDSPLSGLSQLAGVPPSTPQPPSTPGLICSSPNSNLNASPAHKNRFSPFRAGPPNNPSYKVQNLDQRSYPSYPTTFQPLSAPPPTSVVTSHNFNGDVYLSHQNLGNSYRNEPYPTQYSGQYHAQYQPIIYSSSYDMGGHGNYLSHNTFADISSYAPMPADGLNSIFPDQIRTIKTERNSPEGSEGSDSIKQEGEFRCNECNKVFNRICYLKQHNKSFHNGEKPFKCTQCGKRFPVEVLYQEHLAKHAGDKPYKCEVCPKQFNHKTDLRRHMCLHTGEKPFTCDVCGKGFIREDRMVKHADTHKKKAAHVAGGLM